MSDVRIELEEGRDTFRPREQLRGRLRWDLAGERVETIRLELLWHTQGKGTRDADVVETLTVENPPTRGERAFAFSLPAGPYSFSGKLFSVLWTLQAVSEPGDEVVQHGIVLSPTGTEVDLTAEADAGAAPALDRS